MRYIFSLLLLSMSFYTNAKNFLPENHSVNGGITIIPLDATQKPDARYDARKIVTLPGENPKQWLFVVGIPLDKTASIQDLILSKPQKAKIPFHVTDKHYKTQSLHIENIRKVTPTAQDKQRIARENQEMAHIFSQFTATNPFRERYKAPLHGPVTSLFGLQRIYNGIPQTPHSGLDVAAATGASVKAVSQGQVVAIADYFYTGNTVIVDHGMGVYSLYAHLSEFSVTKGQTVHQGQDVGKVGQTGRATGPHLHWSMIMNQTLVEPLLFVSYYDITAMPAKKS